MKHGDETRNTLKISYLRTVTCLHVEIFGTVYTVVDSIGTLTVYSVMYCTYMYVYILYSKVGKSALM
jgi:hypothetical protein